MNPNMTLPRGDVFFRSGMSYQQVHHWNELQMDYIKVGFVFIEYEQKYNEDFIWKCFFESANKTANDLGEASNQFSANEFNNGLLNVFSDRDSYSNQYWDNFMDNLKWSGYFVPVDEFTYFTNPQMVAELNHAYLAQYHFRLKDYFKAVKKDSIETEWVDTPIALLGMWNYLVFYADFLKSCFENETIQHNPKKDWHSRKINLRTFINELPSKQLMSILLQVVESTQRYESGYPAFKRLRKYAKPPVKKFLDQYKEDIVTWVDQKEAFVVHEEMKRDFLKCCMEDRKIIALLELLEKETIIRFDQYLPRGYEENAKDPRRNNFFRQLRRVVGDISVIDHFLIEPVYDQAKPRRYKPPSTEGKYFSFIDYRDLNEAYISTIFDDIEHIPSPEKESFIRYIDNLWKSNLIHIANAFTPPTVLWKLKDDQTCPQLNIFEDAAAKKHLAAFFAKQESIKEQEARFKKLLFNLEKKKTVEEVESYVEGKDPFFDPYLKRKWEMKIDQHLNSLKSIKVYRERRKMELGIKEEDETLDYRTEIWLDEMLKVENEIKRYIPYVKTAFNAALPIRKTVEFDYERHQQSGIEFDQDTLNDQNKWMRGEVMKTLKTKTKLGEIEQINAFCLDFSGSMTHDRMRNLFKILYLLVLGLEDRKSYDAFHFFNSNFIEGSNFTEKFTQRSLLFKILSQVSEITEGEIKYGGFIGTNIGEGVLECHNRIHSFREKISAKKPNSKFVSSLFVITDGEPSVGITDLKELNTFIEEKRKDGDISIKGIYIKDPEDEESFMEEIFGKENFVETIEFGEAVNKFVSIMTKTYREQRQKEKWKNRQRTIKGKNQL